ncbi:MAG: DUF427 domain-containing protein [Alphaproteobacteria bacterium]
MNISYKDPITIEPVSERVRVMIDGVAIADSTDVIRLKEIGHAPVLYVPIEDVRAGVLVPTEHSSRCPLKGEANYYSLRLDSGRVIDNAVWQYAHPKPGVPELANRVAFYPQFVDDFLIGKDG